MMVRALARTPSGVCYAAELTDSSIISWAGRYDGVEELKVQKLERSEGGQGLDNSAHLRLSGPAPPRPAR
jgi:hypothetical protein